METATRQMPRRKAKQAITYRSDDLWEPGARTGNPVHDLANKLNLQSFNSDTFELVDDIVLRILMGTRLSNQRPRANRMLPAPSSPEFAELSRRDDFEELLKAAHQICFKITHPSTENPEAIEALAEECAGAVLRLGLFPERPKIQNAITQ